MAQNRYYSNGPPSTLATGLSAVTPGSTGTIESASITDWPVSYPFTVLIDWGNGSFEVATITQAATGGGPYVFANCIRGDDSGLSPSHDSGAQIVPGFSQRDLTEAAEHVNGFTSGMAPSGITGATAASRYVGATTSGAPVSGTFLTGDWVIDRSGAIWICTAGGTQGTWAEISGGSGFANPMSATGDTMYGGASGAATRLAGNTTATKKFYTQTGTGSVSAAPGWNTIATGDVPTLNQSTTGTAANITDTLDQVPAPAANVAMNSHKLTGLASGSVAGDSVAFGQLPSPGTPLPLTQGGTGLSESTNAALLAALGALGLAGGTLTGPLVPAVAALTFATTMTPIASGAGAAAVFSVTLTASTGTIANPSGTPADGQMMRLRIAQDATGSRTVAWGAGYDWGSTSGSANSAPVLTTAASSIDLVGFEYNAAKSKWCYLSAPWPQGF